MFRHHFVFIGVGSLSPRAVRSVALAAVLWCFVAGFATDSRGQIVAQPSPKTRLRPSETDVKHQEKFIEAMREKVLENYDKAQKLLEELLLDDPKNAAAQFMLAEVEIALKQPAPAMGHARAAFEAEPDNVTYGDTYAKFLEAQGSYKEAGMVYAQLVRSHPIEKRLYLQQGLEYIKAGKPDEALKAFNALEAKMGVSEESAKRKHLLFAAEGKEKPAIEELKKLVAKYPRTLSYRHDLATYYAQIGQRAQAEQTYHEILAIDPSDTRATFALANKEERTTTTTAANPATNEGNTVPLTSLKATFARADIDADYKIKQLAPYLRQLDVASPANAATLLDDLLDCTAILARTHPADAGALILHADILNRTGQKETALEEYVRAAAVDKKRFYPWQYILLLNAELKHIDALLDASNRALDLFPTQPLVLYMNGVANYQKGQYPAAADAFEQALPMTGKNATMRLDTYHQLGRTYTALRQYDKATAAYTEALTKWNGERDIATTEHYGDCLAAQGKTEEAVAYWVKSRTLGNTSAVLAKKIAGRAMVSE